MSYKAIVTLRSLVVFEENEYRNYKQIIMNIQIFGKNKCFDSRLAERFFKERKIKYQFINVLDKGISKKELDSIVGGIKDVDLLFDSKSPLYDSLNIAYITRTADDKKQLLLDNPSLLKTPIVRDCDSKKCTVANGESIWRTWL